MPDSISQKDINREKSQRVIDLIPLIFKAGYIQANGILIGGTALNLEFQDKRFLKDMDIAHTTFDRLPFQKRVRYFETKLRTVANSKGYNC